MPHNPRASDALFAVCQHECVTRRRAVDGFIAHGDLVRLVASTRRTHAAFGGYGLRRGLDPHNTAAGATLVDILCMSLLCPSTLSRLVATRIASRAPSIPARVGRYLAPPHSAELADAAPELAAPYVSLVNLAAFARDYLAGTRAVATTVDDQRDAITCDVVSALRIADVLPTASPAALVAELGDRVLYTDISVCVTTRADVGELLAAVAATGAAHVAPTHAHGLAVCTAQNLVAAAKTGAVDVAALYQALGPLGASPVLFHLGHRGCLVPQKPPPAQILDAMHDADKLALVRLGVWLVDNFEAVDALRFVDAATTVQAAVAVDIPRAWILRNALCVARPPAGLGADDVDPERATLLRWPIASAWGANGAPLADLVTMFGSSTTEFIEAVAGACVDVDTSLTRFFVELAECGGSLGSAARAAAAVCAHALVTDRRFRAGDVRDAFGGTPAGRAIVSAAMGAEPVDPLALVADDDTRNVSTTDLALVYRHVAARARGALEVARRGAKFEVVGAVRALGARVVQLAQEGGCLRCTPRQLIAACRHVAGARPGRQPRQARQARQANTTPAAARRASTVLVLVRACGRNMLGDADNDTCRRVCEMVPLEYAVRVCDAFWGF